jgi:hypothetical protein
MERVVTILAGNGGVWASSKRGLNWAQELSLRARGLWAFKFLSNRGGLFFLPPLASTPAGINNNFSLHQHSEISNLFTI